MASYIRQRPAAWFRTVATLLLLWGMVSCIAFYWHASFSPAPVIWTVDMEQALPRWFLCDYAIAVGASLLGSIAMLRRSRMANPFYVVSLAAVIVQFGYVFSITGFADAKLLAEALVVPAFILGVAIFQIWLAGMATRRGWIR